MSVHVVSYENRKSIGLVRISNPLVNAISPQVVEGLGRALASFEADSEARALVIHCEGRTFVAGGDIASFESADFDTELSVRCLRGWMRPRVRLWQRYTERCWVADWNWRWPACEPSKRPSMSFDDGDRVEPREFEQLRLSSTSRALRHLFFAGRAAARIPGLPSDIRARELCSVGIVVAGTMGGGIAMNFAHVGIPVVLVETTMKR